MMASKRQARERDVRALAEKLGYYLHRFNDVGSHWRGFILVEDDDLALYYGYDPAVVRHEHTRDGMYRYLKRIEERRERERGTRPEPFGEDALVAA